MTQHLPYQKAMPLSGTVFNKELSSVQGGRFELGFISAFTSSLALSYTTGKSNDPLAIMGIGAAIGGTAEALGGGKFANGAVTGAFVALFNHGMHLEEDPSDPPTDEEISSKLTSFTKKLRQFEFQQRRYSKSLHPSLWPEDFSFDGYTLPNTYNLYSEPLIYYDIPISFDNITIRVTFQYSPSDVPQRNTASSIKTPGVKTSFSFAQSGLSGLPKVYLNNEYNHTVGIIFFSNTNDYNQYMNYVFPE